MSGATRISLLRLQMPISLRRATDVACHVFISESSDRGMIADVQRIGTGNERNAQGSVAVSCSVVCRKPGRPEINAKGAKVRLGVGTGGMVVAMEAKRLDIGLDDLTALV
jgi:hypothetical protein